MLGKPKANLGVVAIGRNEGQRLKRCLQSIGSATVLVYVDSGSVDGSCELAQGYGATVVTLDCDRPFTAARARNAGLRTLLRAAPDLQFIQFIDGDCELLNRWTDEGLNFLGSNPEVAAVSGWRRERYPTKTIYHWLCEAEWHGPVGEVRECGGDVMMRVSALMAVGGYREDLIAGEEPELCVRLRMAGWKIWRLPIDMTIHDAGMSHFSQWWRRAVRGGYAFAQGAHLHGATPERHWVWQSRRALLWGFFVPLLCVGTTLILGPRMLILLLIYPIQLMRLIARGSGGLRERALVSLFQMLAKFPEAQGQLEFRLDRLRHRQRQLIEYK